MQSAATQLGWRHATVDVAAAAALSRLKFETRNGLSDVAQRRPSCGRWLGQPAAAGGGARQRRLAARACVHLRRRRLPKRPHAPAQASCSPASRRLSPPQQPALLSARNEPLVSSRNECVVAAVPSARNGPLISSRNECVVATVPMAIPTGGHTVGHGPLLPIRRCGSRRRRRVPAALLLTRTATHAAARRGDWRARAVSGGTRADAAHADVYAADALDAHRPRAPTHQHQSSARRDFRRRRQPNLHDCASGGYCSSTNSRRTGR